MSGATAMLALFVISAALIVYVYFGYPLLLRMNVFGQPIAFARGNGEPSLSIIVPAHNEESTIEAKLSNLLASDYPLDLVEILIGSDGSSDQTEEIARRFFHEGVGLISFPQQQGKSAMQNGLVASATGDILVFTDADCLLPRDALRKLADNFSDTRVGLVTACPRYLNCSATSIAENEGLYLRYETWLRRQESQRGLLAMASGSLFAMRRSLWQPLDPQLGDDFVIPLQLTKTGVRCVADARIEVVTYLSQTGPASMLRMKSRIVHKDLRALLAHRELLNPLICGGVAVALWSHKLLRWLIPYFLLALVASNLFLLDRPFFHISLVLQAAFYGIALIAILIGKRGGVWTAPGSFVLVNLAALLGIAKCVAGRASGAWQTERIRSPLHTVADDAQARRLK